MSVPKMAGAQCSWSIGTSLRWLVALKGHKGVSAFEIMVANVYPIKYRIKPVQKSLL